MDLELEKAIVGHLATDFERELFDAAIKNLDDTNVLNLNNFAYAIRELVRNFLERLAPDEKVKGAPWYVEVLNADKKVTISRAQRMEYAIHGWLSNEFLKNVLKLDITDTITDLKKSIDKMSKYTHISPETFNLPEPQKTREALEMLNNLLRFLMDIEECKSRVHNTIVKDFSTNINEIFSVETFDDIDILSTHSTIKSFMIQNIILKELGSTINVEVLGFVHTRLQIGSDGDVRRDDGYVTYLDFPFQASCEANIQNTIGRIIYGEPNIHIDTNSFYE